MSINLSELIWTILNFILLMLLLRLFLYRPILRELDAHKARVAEGLSAGEKARAARAEQERQLAAALQETGGRAHRILREAKAGDERRKSELLGRANEKAARLRSESRDRIAGEEACARSSVEGSIPRLTSVLVSRLLEEGQAAADKTA